MHTQPSNNILQRNRYHRILSRRAFHRLVDPMLFVVNKMEQELAIVWLIMLVTHMKDADQNVLLTQIVHPIEHASDPNVKILVLVLVVKMLCAIL